MRWTPFKLIKNKVKEIWTSLEYSHVESAGVCTEVGQT